MSTDDEKPLAIMPLAALPVEVQNALIGPIYEALTEEEAERGDADGIAQAVLNNLRWLPVEQRMEAMGMRRAGPFGADGHGIGCAYRRGHDCDCTARTAVYWTEAR